MTSRPSGESDPRGGENEEPERKLYRTRFEALAKGLFRVTPEQYAAEEARQKKGKGPLPRRKRPPLKD